MSSIEMTQTNKRTTPVTTTRVERPDTGSNRVRRWLPMTAITCALLSPGLWADETKVAPVTAAPKSASQTSEPAPAAIVARDPAAEEVTTAPQTNDPATAAAQTSDPAKAATKKPSPTEVKTPNPHADWKPPEMPEPPPFSTQKIDPDIARDLKERWGVEILGMRLATAGYMLDFRFRVLDVDKALPLFDHRIKPHIVAERSNIKLPVPMATKVGAFRPTNRGKNIKSDKTYYMMFGNPDRHVKVGEKVTVVIGDFKIEHLVVN